MACGRDVNKVKTKTSHQNGKKMKENHHHGQTITQLTAPVTKLFVKGKGEQKACSTGKSFCQVRYLQFKNTVSVSPKHCAAH